MRQYQLTIDRPCSGLFGNDCGDDAVNQQTAERTKEPLINLVKISMAPRYPAPIPPTPIGGLSAAVHAFLHVPVTHTTENENRIRIVYSRPHCVQDGWRSRT
eukprot:m.356484 g.356484  ORF g.356484 m.356484 type:complete len:102 (-) comp16605_c0_seq15:4420-4725(-)